MAIELEKYADLIRALEEHKVLDIKNGVIPLLINMRDGKISQVDLTKPGEKLVIYKRVKVVESERIGVQ